MQVIENIYYTDARHPYQTLDLYLPETDSFPVFIYFHGGGLTRGDKRSKQLFPKDLQEKGIAVICANYRLYPEAVYPEFIRDSAAAVAWAYKHMTEYGNITGYFIGGSSAGGYLTQMLCFDRKYLNVYNVDPDKVTGYIMDAGQPTTHFNILKERGLDTRRVIVDEAAPLYHITDARNYPPMQIILAENDMQNRAEQTALLISTLKHFNYDMSKLDYRFMPGCKHCEYKKMYDENGRNLFANLVASFITKYNS